MLELEREIRERVVNVALDEVGGSNGNRYNPTCPHNAQWWCGVFIVWVLNRAGLMVLDTGKWPCARLCESKLMRTNTPQAGDILWCRTINHFAIVTRVKLSRAYTIDGNHANVPVQFGSWKGAGEEFYSISPLIRERYAMIGAL